MHTQTQFQLLLSAMLLLNSSPSLSSPVPLPSSTSSSPSSPRLPSSPEPSSSPIANGNGEKFERMILPITPRSALLSHPIFSRDTPSTDSETDTTTNTNSNSNVDYDYSQFPIFDSTAAQLVRAELKEVKNKYSKAMQYLNGVQVAEVDVMFDPHSQKSVLVPQGQQGKFHNPYPAGNYTRQSATASFSTMSHYENGVTVVAPSAVTKTALTSSMTPISPPPMMATQHSSSSSSYTPSATTQLSLSVSTSSHFALSSPTSVQINLPAPSTELEIDVPELGTDLQVRDLHAQHDSHHTQDNLASRRSTTSSSIALTDYISGSLDVLYYGSLTIGSPAQTLSVDFDTGSADLWLPVGCSNCNGQQFTSSRSSSYHQTGDSFSVQYGSGSVSGYLATENVGLGSTFVKGQYFGAVNSESSDFQSNPNSGVIGMAFSSISSSGKSTYFENLISAGTIAQPYFGFHLTRKQASGSQLCVGCYDSSKFTGGVNWIPVISQTYWSVSMTGFSANGNRQNALSQSIIAAMDTGTTLIYVPTSVADSFYSQIPGASQANQFGQGFYQFPCKPQSGGSYSLSINLNGKPFSIAFTDFNLGRTASGSTMCVGGVLAVGDGFPDNLAIVGDEFLKSWYSIYDYSNNVRVGLASSINAH